jgi:transcriptional regulator with XRE-family HTH domain
VTRPAFADRLRAARAAAGLRPEEMAARAGLHRSSYYRLEQGNRPDPAWSTVTRLVAAGAGLEHFLPPEAIAAAAARIASRPPGATADADADA